MFEEDLSLCPRISLDSTNQALEISGQETNDMISFSFCGLIRLGLYAYMGHP